MKIHEKVLTKEEINASISAYIDERSILRFLNFRGDTPSLEQLEMVRQGINEVLNVSDFRYQMAKCAIRIEGDAIELLEDQCSVGSHFLSKDLSRFLENSDQLIMVGVTLGSDVIKWIQRQMKMQPSKGIVSDACASVIVDAYCDWLQDEITKSATLAGRFCTQRFSPGYGDLDLQVQQVLAESLNLSKRIGVHLTSHYQLIPEKSVLFLMGESQTPIQSMVQTCGNDCSACKLKYCPFRRIHE